jgi:1,4-alpha-glucan branching enzyme
MSSTGHLILFLHAHLPFVRHPEDDNFLEESWLYEAITETYLPILLIAERWQSEGIAARLTFSMTPTLIEMLRDELLIRRYRTHLQRLVELVNSEARRLADDERFSFTTRMYRDSLTDSLDRFENRYGQDLVGAFKILQDAGLLEVVTSAATHAYLPAFNASCARGQIRTGIKAYRRHFQRDPPGIWLPECGFVPGLDQIVADEGLEYFLLDSHGLELARPRPVFGTCAPIICPSGVFAFGRDRDSSAQVWSAESGYPGDGRYREFYRDVTYDLDGPAMAPFRLADGTRKSTGLKYHRVTSRDVPLDAKQPYHRGWALQAVEEHAADFVAKRAAAAAWQHAAFKRPTVIVAPYDAELFGHWWFEGPEFLDQVVRKVARGQSGLRLSTPTDVIKSGLDFQVSMPAASSWGAHGYSHTWLNDSNDWIWPHLHHAVSELESIVCERKRPSRLEQRALNQLARECLLACSSDWPFIMTMGTMVPYAVRRVHEHVNRFNRLLQQYRTRAIDEAWLSNIEDCDNIFPHIDFRDFAPPVSRAGPIDQRVGHRLRQPRTRRAHVEQ